MQKFVAYTALLGCLALGACSKQPPGEQTKTETPIAQPVVVPPTLAPPAPVAPLIAAPPIVIPAPTMAVLPIDPIPPAAPQFYTVQFGDTLSAIARRLSGKSSRWTELKAINNIVDETKLQPGHRLTIPLGWQTPTAPEPVAQVAPPLGAEPTHRISAAPLEDTPSWNASRIIASTTANGITKSYFSVPEKAQLQSLSQSVAAGQQVWRTNALQVGKVTFSSLGISATDISTWEIRSGNGNRSLLVHWGATKITAIELAKYPGNTWHSVAATESGIPFGYSLNDFTARSPELKTVLLKTRVHW